MPILLKHGSALWILIALLHVAIPAYALNNATASNSDTHQTAEIVVTEVTNFLTQQADNYPGSVEVVVDTSRAERFPACAQAQAYLPGSKRLRSNMSVGVRCLAPEAWDTRVRAHLSINGFFYVTNRIMEPGEIVALDDLIAREGDILSLARGVVVDPSQLIGQIVTQRITSGSPIKSSQLRNPMSVLRGQMVRIEARGQSFLITSEGQTMQDGAPGEQIRVRTSSGQVITATVLNSNTVFIPM